MTDKKQTPVTSSHIRFLYWAHVITQFGSYLSFIPLGKALSEFMDIGQAWAVLLIIKSAGYFFLPRKIAQWAHRIGNVTLIVASQLLAAVALIFTLVGFMLDSSVVMIIGLILVSCFSMVLVILFPAILNRLGKDIFHVKSYLSSVLTVEFLAFIFARAAGGILNEQFSLEYFLIVDAITFGIAAVIWKVYGTQITSVNLPEEKVLSNREYRKFFLKPYSLFQLIKKFYYGMFNPFIPVLIITYYHYGDSEVGIFYFVVGFAAIIGSILAKRVSASRARCIVVTFLEFIFIVAGFVSTNIYFSFACFFVCTIFQAIADVLAQTLFFNDVNKEYSQEASAVFATTVKLSMFFGYGAYLLLAKWITPQIMFLVGICTAIISVASLVTLSFLSKSASNVELTLDHSKT